MARHKKLVISIVAVFKYVPIVCCSYVKVMCTGICVFAFGTAIEMYCDDAHLSVCVYVCMSLTACLHHCT